MSELSCWTCGAILGGYGYRGQDKNHYCSSSCEREQWPDDLEEDCEMPEEDKDGQYDTLEERDLDKD